MRVEPPVFDAIYSAPPVIQPGSEAAREDENKRKTIPKIPIICMHFPPVALLTCRYK